MTLRLPLQIALLASLLPGWINSAFGQTPPRWVAQHPKIPTPILQGVFTPDSKLFLTAGIDGNILAWNTANGQRAFVLAEKRRPPHFMAFSPDGRTLLTGEPNGVQLWDWATRQPTKLLTGFKGPVFWHAFSADGKKLHTHNAGQQQEWKVWDWASGQEESSWLLPNVNAGDVDFAPDRQTSAVATLNVASWSAAQRAAVLSFRPAKRFTQPRRVRYTPDGLTVAVGYADGEIVLLDARTWKGQLTLKGHKGMVTGLEYAPNGKHLVSGDTSGNILLWQTTTLDIPDPIAPQGPRGPVTFVHFSPDSALLAAGGVDGTVRLWELAPLLKQVVVKTAPRPPVKPGSPRLALVSTERGEAVQNLLALAEVKLSERGDIQLVERRALDNLLAEQKLSLAGFVKHDQVIQVGKLLGVNLFAVVETDRVRKDATGLVVFHAVTGARLSDAALSGGTLEERVDSIAEVVRGARKKLATIEHLKTVCLTTVRNVDLPRAKDVFCETVGFFLERGLVSSPSLALLERSRLEQVLREKNLPTDSPLGQLLAALVRIELEISRGDDGQGLKATALLFDSRGKLLARPSVTVAAPEATELAQAILIAAAKAIDANPGSVTQDRLKEALRFAAEAEFQYFHQDIKNELRYWEAAVALNSRDINLRWQLANALRRSSTQLAPPLPRPGVKLTPAALHQALEYLVRALEQEAVIQPLLRSGKPDLARPRTFYNLTLPDLKGLERVYFYAFDAESRALVAAIRDQFTQLFDENLDHALTAVTDRKSFLATISRLRRPGDLALESLQDLPSDRSKKILEKHLSRWFDLALRFGLPPLSPQQVSAIYWVLEQGLRSQAALGPIQRYRAELRQHGDPFVHLHEAFLDCEMDLLRPKITLAERQQRLRTHRLAVEKMLAAKADAVTPALRHAAYQTFALLVNRAPDRNIISFQHPFGQEMAEMCRFMIAQKDFSPDIVGATVSLARQPTRENTRQALEFLDLLQPLLDSPTYRYLSNDPRPEAEKAQTRNFLTQWRQTYLKRFPDLGAPRVDLWTDLRELIDVQGASAGIVRIGKPLVHGGAVFVLALGQESPAKRYLQLLRFSVPEGKKTVLGRIAVDTGYTPPTVKALFALAGQPNHGEHRPFVVAALIHEGRYIAGTRDQGIFFFPISEGEVQRLDTEAGLPSNHVQCFTILGGKLFAALGEENREAYLVAHDLKTRQTTVLASSRRKDKLSPFDDTVPWQVSHFLADTPRQRALFLMNQNSQAQLCGLWELDARTHRLRQLLQTGPQPAWISPVQNNQLFLTAFDATYRLDLATDQMSSRPFDRAKGGMPFFVEASLPNVLALARPGPLPTQLREGFFLRDGWLWSPSPFARISLDGRLKEMLASPRPKSTLVFQAWEAFEPVGEWTLIGDGHGLWLARTRKSVSSIKGP